MSGNFEKIFDISIFILFNLVIFVTTCPSRGLPAGHRSEYFIFFSLLIDLIIIFLTFFSTCTLHRSEYTLHNDYLTKSLSYRYLEFLQYMFLSLNSEKLSVSCIKFA